MARGFQQCIVVGNMGGDPESKYLDSGRCITTFSVATTEMWKREGKEAEELTEWHRIKVFGRLAERCAQYLRKGRLVTVVGKLRTEAWNRPDGEKAYYRWLYADEVQFHGNAGGASGAETGNAPARNQRPEPSPMDDDGGDDGIPF